MAEKAKASAYQAALRLLAVRARGRRQLELLLARKGFPEDERADAIARLERLGYVNDDALADARAAALLAGGKLGPLGVQRRLMNMGLPVRTVHQALARARAELDFDPLESARQLLLRRKVTGAKAARLLAARGFGQDVARQLLGDAALELPPEEE